MLLFCFVCFAYVRVKKGNQETDSRQGAKRRSLRLLSPGEDGGEGICWKMGIRKFAGTVLFVGGLDFVLQSWGLNSGPQQVLG